MADSAPSTPDHPATTAVGGGETVVVDEMELAGYHVKGRALELWSRREVGDADVVGDLRPTAMPGEAPSAGSPRRRR